MRIYQTVAKIVYICVTSETVQVGNEHIPQFAQPRKNGTHHYNQTHPSFFLVGNKSVCLPTLILVTKPCSVCPHKFCCGLTAFFPQCPSQASVEQTMD